MEQDINQLIADHYGFIIKTVSETSNRYVRIGDDDSFSIGLLAFQEAYEKYDDTKGPFLAFAKLVIRSRVIDYLRKENRQPDHDSLEDMQEAGGQLAQNRADLHDALAYREEIEDWQDDLASFGISLDYLADQSPKRKDTRQRAINISEKSAGHPPITKPLYQKKRLPIKLTAEFNQVSQKVIQGSKTFIISVIILFKEEYHLLVGWIKGEDENDLL